MKYLSIMRHGKAERLEGFPSDQARPLTNRGIKDATLMGTILARSEPAPDWIISSTVVRARQTTERIVESLAFERPVIWEEHVYEAGAETLLHILSNVPPEIAHAVLIGHNPGLQELVSGLCAGTPDRLGVTLATGAVAHLELEVFWWNQVRWGCGTLQSLVKPKLLRDQVRVQR